MVCISLSLPYICDLLPAHSPIRYVTGVFLNSVDYTACGHSTISLELRGLRPSPTESAEDGGFALQSQYQGNLKSVPSATSPFNVHDDSGGLVFGRDQKKAALPTSLILRELFLQ